MTDKQRHIEELLQRFMEGETTLDQERQLGEWLRTHQVDDTLKPYQQMFADFDAGLPSEPALAPRHRIVWWRWVAAAAVACLLIMLGARFAHYEPAEPSSQPITTEEVGNRDIDSIQVLDEPQPLLAITAKEVMTTAVQTKKAPSKIKVKATPHQDSVEIARTDGELELAESEYLAAQQELQQELKQLRQQRAAQQTGGWYYTTLPCQ